jgi:DMSO/TMAO reductase YedYZ molybdopterin-dependent catalytic subunit
MAYLSRRQFLRVTAVTVAAGSVAACGIGQVATPAAVSKTPQPLPVPSVAPAQDTIAGESAKPKPFGQGESVSITENDKFFSLAITQRGDWLNESTYNLTVSGAVATPLKLSLSDVKAFPAVEHMRTLECIGNSAGGPMIGNAMWKGVRLSDVLWKAGLTSAAVEIKFSSADGYTTTIPVGLATRQDSLLVYEMNGKPLPDQHGAPLRGLFPGRYGMKLPKWITAIEAVTQPMLGHWERQGWSNDAFVQINSQIRTPSNGDDLAAGIHTISGTAFSDESGIARLEVSTDGGKTWNTARLLRGPTPLAWSEWSYDWQAATPGDATIIARAIDNDGNQQPLQIERSVSPDGNIEGISAVHRIAVTVLT